MQSKIAKAIVEALASGYQLDPEAFGSLLKFDEKIDVVELVMKAVQIKYHSDDKQTVLTKQDIEKALPPDLKETDSAHGEAEPMVPEYIEPEYKIIKDPTDNIFPIEGLKGFQSLFRSRLEKLMKIVKERPDSYQIRQISTLKKEVSNSSQKIAGLVMNKKIRRAYVELTIDDISGRIRTIALDEAVKKNATEVCLDQLAVLDLQFSKRGSAIVKDVYSPDIPERLPNRSKKEVYAVFTSDTHVGSNTFLFNAFNRFILWLNGKLGDDSIVRRVKYLIIGGDVVDGVGIYPNQEKELQEVDIYEQHKKFIQLIEQVPKHIKIFIIPGNHDPVRQALPQPGIPEKYAGQLYHMENVVMLGNPIHLNLHGVNVLVCHGRSLDDIVATTPGLTFSKPASAMKALLKARHLAPTYGGRTPIAPEQEDHLVIEEVPDIFHTGHVHTVDVDTYRGTLLINSGTWQGQTSYQMNMGLKPTPGIVPIVNLATLEVTLKNFVMME
ncbi:MAG: DNA-directed DNA polymerase II small subunit [archaeon]|nr:DNA-directed DNA polymerase II small subunit [archaeon]MCP8306201.1 DNA-directed DNA polymerase II small subunit [archaeon]